MIIPNQLAGSRRPMLDPRMLMGINSRAQIGLPVPLDPMNAGPQLENPDVLGFELPSWIRGFSTIKKCCAYSTFTGRVECTYREVSPFDYCYCTQSPPPFDFPSISCQQPRFTL